VKTLRPGDIEVSIDRVEAAEVDEMWSYVGKKHEPRWLWHALDHGTGKVLAYVFGRRKDAVLQELQKLLQPFGSNASTPITGVRMRGSWPRSVTILANGRPRRSNASISHSVCALNG
jgi:IS1 family transposase